MQLRDSGPRAILALCAAIYFYVKRAHYPNLIFVAVGIFCLASAADLLLALRWWWTTWSASYVAKHPSTLNKKKQEEKRAARADAKNSGKGSSKKK